MYPLSQVLNNSIIKSGDQLLYKSMTADYSAITGAT